MKHVTAGLEAAQLVAILVLVATHPERLKVAGLIVMAFAAGWVVSRLSKA